MLVVLLASLEKLTNSKYPSKGSIRISVLAFLVSHWSIRFSQCTMCIHSLLLEQFSEFQSALGTTFTGGYLEAGTSFLKRVTGTILQIVKTISTKQKNLIDFRTFKSNIFIL
jgi:hypothetical protein